MQEFFSALFCRKLRIFRKKLSFFSIKTHVLFSCGSNLFFFITQDMRHD